MGSADIRLDEAQAASVIQSQFPALAPASVRYLGEGCDSCGFDVNGEWVFRFPKRADVAEQLALESRMLPILAERSPLPLPIFSFHGQPSAAYPYPFAGYRKLPGVQAMRIHWTEGDWAPAVARFLGWLHRFPSHQAEANGVEPRDVGELIDEVRADALDDFERLHDAIEDAPFDQWHQFFEAGCAPVPDGIGPVLVHGDLAAEHVLCDPERGQVTGVIDWSEMALSDAAIDLAAFYHWGGRPCFDAAVSAYGAPLDEHAVTRARFLAACRGVGDVVFGLDMGRPDYVETGRRALMLCLGA
jgi:aminoglycoside phosphotransferase (APT) family kinase protein